MSSTLTPRRRKYDNGAYGECPRCRQFRKVRVNGICRGCRTQLRRLEMRNPRSPDGLVGTQDVTV